MRLNQLVFCALLVLVCFFITVTESFAPPLIKEQTVRAATDNADIRLTVPDGVNCSITSATAVDEGGIINGDIKSHDLAGIPDDPGYDYPFGLVEFTLNCTNGDNGPVSAYIDVQFIPDSGPVDLTKYRNRKYGPLPNGMVIIPPPLNGEAHRVYENGINQWYDFMFDGETGAQLLNSSTFRLYFVDGGRGDDVVGIIDGLIVDQGGPARIPTVPTMNEWGMIIFMVLAGLGSLNYLKRRKRPNS